MNGYVYIMVSSSKDRIVKIGGTTRHPNERARELNSTGVPFDWIPVEYEYVSNWEQVEGLLHAHFQASRVNNQREFFAVNPRDAILTLRKISSSYRIDTPEDLSTTNPEQANNSRDAGEVESREEETIRLQDLIKSEKNLENQKRLTELFSKEGLLRPTAPVQAVRDILDLLTQKGVSSELRNKLYTDWSGKQRFMATDTVSMRCAECNYSFSVTVVRNERHIRCPNCRRLHEVAINWE